MAVITSIIGVVALAAGMQGWLLKKTSPVERLCLIIGGLCMILPGLSTDMAGIGLCLVVLLAQKLTGRPNFHLKERQNA